MIEFGPNPPIRRNEDFPKTTTIPEGWTTEKLSPAALPEITQDSTDEQNPSIEATGNNGNLSTSQLDPFPQPKTFPTGWDLSAL